MTARFRLPAGRTYNVRASELARDRQHTEVVCNIFLLDNTVQAFRVNVSNLLLAYRYHQACFPLLDLYGLSLTCKIVLSTAQKGRLCSGRHA